MIPDRTRRRILLVDDDDAIVESLTIALEDSYDLIVARNGADALDALDAAGIDVVLLDLMMPVLDGPAMLRRRTPEQARVPVVIMSAGADAPRLARELGVPDYLTKPFGLDALDAAIARALGRRSGGGGDAGDGDAGDGEAGPVDPDEPPAPASARSVARAPTCTVTTPGRGHTVGACGSTGSTTARTRGSCRRRSSSPALDTT